MGYRAVLLAAFPQRLGDRMLYMLNCSKQRNDCEAVTMGLESAPSALDPEDVEIGSYQLTQSHLSRAVIEEIRPRSPVAKRTIVIDTDQGTALLDIIGQSREDDWKAEVKCEEVQKAIPSDETKP
jgi:hypothetical protein